MLLFNIVRNVALKLKQRYLRQFRENCAFQSDVCKIQIMLPYGLDSGAFFAQLHNNMKLCKRDPSASFNLMGVRH